MKGVSPVVATVLMVAVAIAAAVVAYSWFMSMQASVQAEASRGAGTVGKERLMVASIRCDGTSPGAGNLHIVLRNLGDEQISGNFTVYVRDATTSEVNASTTCSNKTVDAKQDLDVNLGTCNPNISCNGLPDKIIVEVHAPGGAVTSAQQRIK